MVAVAAASFGSVSGFASAPAVASVGGVKAGAALPASTLGMRPNSGFLRADRLAYFERELGQPISWYVGMADRESPENMRSSVFGQMQSASAVLPTVASRMSVVMSVPLAFGRNTAKTEEGRLAIREDLLETAGGRWDDAFRSIARSLAAGGYADAVVRLGHEFTGPFFPWSAQGNADAYIAAFRHVHDVMTAEVPALQFEWNGARNTFGVHGPPAYPGDAYVDVIGLDVYYEPAKGDPVPFTDDLWTRRYIGPMTIHRNFAIAHGKPVSYAEWGVGGIDEPIFIQRMHDWFASLPSSGGGQLLYQSYFSATDDEYNLDARPRTKARYIELFGAGNTSTPPPTTIAPTTVAPTTIAPTTIAPTTTVLTTTTVPVTTTTPSTSTTAPAATTSTTAPVAAPTTTAPATALTINVASTYRVRVGTRVKLNASINASSVLWWQKTGPAQVRWHQRVGEDAIVTFPRAGKYELVVRAARGDSVIRRLVQVTVVR